MSKTIKYISTSLLGILAAISPVACASEKEIEQPAHAKIGSVGADAPVTAVQIIPIIDSKIPQTVSTAVQTDKTPKVKRKTRTRAVASVCLGMRGTIIKVSAVIR